MSTTTSRLLQDSKMWSHAHDTNNASDKGSFWRFSKRKRKILHWSCFVPFGHASPDIFSSLCFWSCFVPFCHISPDIFCSKDKNLESYNSFPTFWGKKWNLLFIYHYSLLLFTVTIHLYYSLRIFAYLRGVIPYISSKFWVCLVQDFFPRESHHLWAFLWEISLLTTTSLLSLQNL